MTGTFSFISPLARDKVRREFLEHLCSTGDTRNAKLVAKLSDEAFDQLVYFALTGFGQKLAKEAGQ